MVLKDTEPMRTFGGASQGTLSHWLYLLITIVAAIFIVYRYNYGGYIEMIIDL